MSKNFTYHLMGALLLSAAAATGISALAGAGQSPARKLATREDVAKWRAEHPLKAKSKAAKPARVHAGDKQLYGFQCYCDYGDLAEWSGAVKILAGPTCPEPVFRIEDGVVSQAEYMDGKAFVVLYDSNNGDSYVTYRVYDAETWDLEADIKYVYTTPNILPYSLAYDHTTSKLYGCFFADAWTYYDDEDAQLGYIDFTDALDPVKIVSATLPVRMRAMTFDANGQLYGLTFDNDLYKINKFTGEVEPTGVAVDLPSQDGGNTTDSFMTYGRESMCCDWESGDFFITYGDDNWNSYVARFNPTTGEAELVADYSYTDFGSEDCNVLTGLYFIQKGAAPSDVTPAAPSDLNVSAVGTELKAQVSFTMPSLDTEGNPIDADLLWSISDGANELASGQAHSGSTVETAVELSQSGKTFIIVTAALGEAISNPADASVFIGCDEPYIYGTPTARAAGNRITVSWQPAAAVNGGNLDPVTYTITRLPDNVDVAQGIGETSFVDDIPSDYLTEYSYRITPYAGTIPGAAVTSRSVYAGTFIPLPLDENFDNERRFLFYPVIDANRDDNIWEYSTKYGGVAMYPANSNDADDYLLIGPFKMEKGSTYTFHMSADGHNFKENIAVYVGTDPESAASFSTELIAPAELDPMKGKRTFDAAFEPEESGSYYFGIKACTTGASQYIYVYDVAVREIGAEMPAAPSDLTLTPEADAATISFTLPSLTVGGSELSDLSEARIYRDNLLIATISDGILPGATVSYRDEEEVTKGFHLYTVVAASSLGEGKSVADQIWRGADFPGRPTNLRIWEDLETPGLMHATFNHPERGYYGGYINPDDITYIIDYLVMGKSSGEIELGKGTDHTFRLPFDASKQDIFAGSVYGRNSEGSIKMSSNWTTQVAYFGEPVALPIRESWAGMSQKSGIWGGQPIDDKPGLYESFWDIRDGSYGNVKAYDGDGGFLALGTQVENGGKRILTPRFSVEGTTNPTLVFYYRYSPEALEFNVEILVDDQLIKTLRPIELNADNADKWLRLQIPLSEFIGCKYLQIGFAGRGKPADPFACIDNVSIADLRASDLSVAAFKAPAKVNANEETQLQLTVRNNGSEAVAAGDYTVRFFKNGAMLAELDGRNIEPDAMLDFSFTDVPSVVDPEETSYRAEIAYDADENADDNATSDMLTRVVIADYPVPAGLSINEISGSVTLAWDDPDMSTVPGVSLTETFESYEPFIINNIGSWGLYDGDGLTTVRLATSMGLLDYPHIGEPMAWQVFNPAAANLFHSAWSPRSGSNMLVSFQASTSDTRDFTCNDWLISPELNGSAQQISFYARAGLADTSELFDFMISDKSADPADFKPLESDVNVPYTSGDQWTEFIYRLPEGTRYFAIVHKTTDGIAMLLDDITFIPAGSAAMQLDLLGFNVYRDGIRINDEPIGDNFINDSDVEVGSSYSYNVSAVWNLGESRLSEPVSILVTSVRGIADHAITVSGLHGAIRIEGGQGERADIFNASGLHLASLDVDGTATVAIAMPGVYVVRVADRTVKVAVR